ncbi:MAG: hypothetical protein IJD04_01210 [Desulfovibrionaceae bacterium]|nr:hypothetical protein [Desulfovibrionaceae bacterium]
MTLLFSWGVAGTTLFLLGVGQGLILAVRQKDIFFQAVLLFVLLHGLLDVSLLRIEGCMAIFLPLGIIYGREWSKRSQLCL